MIAGMRGVAWRHACAVAAAALPLFLLSARGAIGLERLQRRFDLERGLPFSEVYSVKQDTSGFIWIASGGGLFRYDGVELRPWPRESSRSFVKSVSTGPAGEVLFRDYVGRLYEVAGDGIRPVEGPDASPFVTVGPPAWDARDTLWALTPDRISFRPSGGGWREFSLAQIGGERPLLVEDLEDGGPILITDKGIWRIDAGSSAARLASIEGAEKALLREDGSLVVLQHGGRVMEIANGTAREIFNRSARPIDMIQRGHTLWVSYDTALVALRPGEPPEILGPDEKVPSGGPLLVDREGSLWMGTFRGLLQYPVPETAAWAAADGMPSNSTRRLALSEEGIWVDSWSGLTLLRRQGDAWRPERVPDSGTGALCVTENGALWTGYPGHFLEYRDSRFTNHPRADLLAVSACSAGSEGRVWLLSNLGLVAIREGPVRSEPAVVALPNEASQAAVGATILEDSGGTLWVTADQEVCRADARAVASGAPAEWSCSTAEGTGALLSLVEVAPGTLWAATLDAGVYRLASRGWWEPIPGSRDLPTRLVRRLRPSPSGGAWIVSFGTILRAVERPGSADGWEIVERLSPWHGLMISDAEDILEETSGDLWITTLAGVVHIPSEVRREEPSAVNVVLVDVLVDGAAVAWQEGVTLPYRRNRIEPRFAGLSYRDPGRLQYQVRLGPDAPWRDASGRPSFHFVDLPPGTYRAEVRVSLDGLRWSERSAGLSFEVLPPFWRTWWFTSLVVVALASATYALYRYRLAHLLRLERMRTRIAADLHDDMGASLSRIAIQSELVRTPAVLRREEADRLLSEIGDSARSLVDSMSDIVWSIDPKRDDLTSLVSRVREFALGILEPLGVSLSLEVARGAANVRLAPEQRRHLYLLFKEAVNNIAKHAGCRNVSIVLRVEGERLSVEVKDDGRGFDASTPASGSSASRGGHGLRSMVDRAAQLGGTLKVASRPGQGTILNLSCPIDHGGA